MNVCSTIAYTKQLNEVMQVTPKQQLVKVRAAALRDMDGEVQRLALVIPTIVTDHAQAGGSPTKLHRFRMPGASLCAVHSSGESTHLTALAHAHCNSMSSKRTAAAGRHV